MPAPRLAPAPPVPLDPPADVSVELRRLRDALDAEIPAKRLDHNLLIASWNIRAFGGLTEKWRTDEHDSPKRNLADVLAIADILSRFDVIAVQETRGKLLALRRTLAVLGTEWGFLLTDVTRGRKGNDERLAFLFDLRRVKPAGLAGELVVPQEELEQERISEGALREQFARTPYAVSFRSGAHDFTLVTLHVRFGKKPAERIGELRCIAEWLARWAAEGDAYGDNLITLGDFNIDRRDDPNYQAFVSKGLRPPDELDGLERTTSDLPGRASYYDQIAWFHEAERDLLSFRYTGRAGVFKWTDHLLRELEGHTKSYRISDHYPLWAEFSIRAP